MLQYLHIRPIHTPAIIPILIMATIASFLDEVRDTLRLRQVSYRTEETYLAAIRRCR